MESYHNQAPCDQTTTKDFIEMLKDFLNETLLDLQGEGRIPPILNASKAGTPRSSKKKTTN